MKFALNRPQSNRPISSKLAFSLRKLGDTGDVPATANHWAFILDIRQSNRPPSQHLPFALRRKLGELGETGEIITVEPPKPLPKNPFKPLIAFDMACTVANAVVIGHCQTMAVNGDTVTNCHNVKRTDGMALVNALAVWQSVFYPVATAHRLVFSDSLPLNHCRNIQTSHFVPIVSRDVVKLSPTVGFVACAVEKAKHIANFYHCQRPSVQGIKSFNNSISFAKKTASLAKCQDSTVLPAVAVPCRYYPIPEPPPTPVVTKCRIRPKSDRLPFHLSRKRNALPSNQLPFSLDCWHDDSPDIIPSLGVYIVKNTVTATLGGIAFSPMSFSIKTDMNSYCWSGQVELSASQYAKIKEKLGSERGNEPLITVDINGFLFSIIAEEISRSRAFVNHSYSISGRSVTARLGADYAVARSDVVKLDSYASQLINSQLADLPFGIERFEIADWLIPADSYAINNKTPIAVINEIVLACGGFVWSDPNLPKLYLQKRWKVNAWELATANPDMVLSVDVVKSISDQKRTNPRYNTVILVGGKQAGEVFRQRQGRDRIAPIDTSDLYTDRGCIIAKGCQILSDSGTHGEYRLVMRWADKYNIHLAELGQIWQVNDPEGEFKGVVTSVSVDVKLENDVPTVWQTVGIDRYLDV